MLHFEYDRLLKSLTTFKIGGSARAFAEITDVNDLPEAFRFGEELRSEGGPANAVLPTLILGGGSNMLVSDAGYNGLVIHIANRGLEVMTNDELRITKSNSGNDEQNLDLSPIRNSNESGDFSYIRIAAGEVWDVVVKFAVEHGLWGIENLSRIPGRAGAVPVQNVGAYGPEAKEFIVTVEVYDRTRNEFRTLTNEECHFGYRTSIFNTTEKGRYVILSMTLRLSNEPRRNLTYPDVHKWFGDYAEPSQQEIRQAIIAIRDRKFPFPAESIEGNAGSFFKNSTLTADEYASLEARFAKNLPDYLEKLQQYAQGKGQRAKGKEYSTLTPLPSTLKIPSAFLLEACGLKGFRRGDVMLNPTQPVVVLNVTGNATASDVLSLVKEVREIVEAKTGLHLYTEPELIGFTEHELRSYGFNDSEIKRYIVR